MTVKDILATIFCLKSTQSPDNPERNPQQPPLSSPGGSADDALTVNRLRQDVLDAYARDSRLSPFVTLFRLIDDPKIDFTSEDAEQLLAEFKKLNEGLEPSTPPKPIPSSSKFFDDDASIERVDTGEFSNWGKTVDYHAPYTFVVRSIAGVGKIVKWAAQEGRKVRVSGFRHSWSDVFGGNGDVMIMFLPFDVLTVLPYKQPPADWKSELLGIEIVPEVAGKTAPAGHSFCKIMAGTTNDQFRQWCFDHKTWCIPLNVIMVEVTFGGTNAPICHGAGLTTNTLSDLVVEVSYIDAKGDLQTVNDPVELRAASGAFGLLGVVVSVTIQLDQMGVTDMVPVKLPLPLAIPPPKDYAIPAEVQKMIDEQGITEKMLEQAKLDFIQRCEDEYYLEWFWFPYQNDVWVNSWTKRPITPQDRELNAYPGDSWLNGVKSQQIQASLAEAVVDYTPFRWLPGRVQAFLFGAASMFALPNVTDVKDAIKTYQSEALHFRRGIQNFRCWDTEWEIPIPTRGGKIDHSVIQRAWWDGISAMYSRKDAPVRVALEMRLTGSSNVLLAPQRGNTGTVSIEVLTTLITPQDDWATFMQLVADRWTSYDLKDEQGRTLYPRPHWAKQWSGLQVHGKPIERYITEDAYKEAFSEFRDTFGQIVGSRGSSVEESLNRFGNHLLERLIFQ